MSVKVESVRFPSGFVTLSFIPLKVICHALYTRGHSCLLFGVCMASSFSLKRLAIMFEAALTSGFLSFIYKQEMVKMFPSQSCYSQISRTCASIRTEKSRNVLWNNLPTGASWFSQTPRGRGHSLSLTGELIDHITCSVVGRAEGWWLRGCGVKSCCGLNLSIDFFSLSFRGGLLWLDLNRCMSVYAVNFYFFFDGDRRTFFRPSVCPSKKKKNSGQTDGRKNVRLSPSKKNKKFRTDRRTIFIVRLSVHQKKKKKFRTDRRTFFVRLSVRQKKKKKKYGQTDGHFFVRLSVRQKKKKSCYVTVFLLNVVIVIAPPTGQCENEEWPIGPKILSHDQRPDLNRCHLIIKSVPLSKSSQSALSLKAASQSLSLLNWYIFSLLSLKAIRLVSLPPPQKKVSPWNRQHARHPFENSRHEEFLAFLVYFFWFKREDFCGCYIDTEFTGHA